MVKVIVLLVIIIAILYFLAANYFFKIIQVRGHNKLAKEITVDQQHTLYNEEKWYHDVPKEKVSVKSDEGFSLKAYYIEAPNKSNKTAIIIHGIRGSKTAYPNGAAAKIFYDQGYNLLIPDNRSHGESEGKYIGFGWLDRKDYLHWIDLIIKQNGPESKIVVWGISMGGATTMMLSGEKLPEQVKAFVEDCGYSNMEEELTLQAKRLYHLPKWPTVPTLSMMSKIFAGYTYSEADAVKQLSNNKRPMLFIHGTKDSLIPIYMMDKIYNATQGYKQKLAIEGAGHLQSIEKNYDLYKSTVKKFLEEQVS